MPSGTAKPWRRLLAVLAAVGNNPHPAPEQGGLPQGSGTQGWARLVHGDELQHPRQGEVSRASVAALLPCGSHHQGWERRASSRPVPAGMAGGNPCMESLSGCPSHDALCACGWVTWPCPTSSGLPGALQRDEVPPAANLPPQAGRPRPGRTWEHPRVWVQTLPLPGHSALGDNRGGGRNPRNPRDRPGRVLRCCAGSQTLCHAAPRLGGYNYGSLYSSPG